MARPTAITSLQDSPSHGKRNWLIYADSGAGKTVLSGTAPNALFLTVEAAGTESAKALGSTADEWTCNTWEEFQDAYEWVKNEGINEYEWVLVDSISEMEELAWADHLEEAHARNAARNIFQPAIQDYQIIGNKMKRVVDSFNRLPINVLYTAQTMRIDVEDQESEDDTTLLLPLIGSTKNGVISQKICGKVTLIGLLIERPPKDEQKETIRRLYLQGGKRYVAKDRHDTFPRFVDDTTILEMDEAVNKRQAQAGAKKTSKKKGK